MGIVGLQTWLGKTGSLAHSPCDFCTQIGRVNHQHSGVQHKLASFISQTHSRLVALPNHLAHKAAARVPTGVLANQHYSACSH